jgi:ATP-binding cassette, subfamily B, bacterial
MWRLCRLGYTHQPRLVWLVVVLTVLRAVPDALFALWLKLLADAALAHHGRTALIVVGLMAVSGTLTWFLDVLQTRSTRRFRDRVTVALESHVANLQATVSGLEHQERQDYLDRLAVLRNQVFVLDHMYASLLNTVSWIVRVGVTVALLASIHPLLVLLLAFAIPTVVSSTWRPAVERRVEEQNAQYSRLAEHLFQTTTSPAAGKEVRVAGIGDDLIRRRRAAWQRWYGPIARARWITAISHAFTWLIFGLGYMAAVVFVAAGLRAPVGSVLLILAAGVRLSSYVSATIGELSFLRGIWIDGARRLAWLEDYATSFEAASDVAPPDRMTDGIRLDHVSFRYPGSERLALDDVTLHLPAGSVVAVVGENGAGKSTLIKLLSKMYEPSAGAITIDGRPLRRIAAAAWRSRLAGAFQDFFRFEFSAQHSVGLGDLPRLDDEPAVVSAVARAGAGDVLDRLPDGLSSQLGPTWPDGQELSFGQWQKVALSRGYMREEPLLMMLDEPTAALDAETEHQLFESYSRIARRGSEEEQRRRPRAERAYGTQSSATDDERGGPVARSRDAERRNSYGSTNVGGITILVSHRFSTVRMADLIVVLDGSKLAEVGSHDELMRRGGPYAELYRIQAAAYR